jgi:hypothetical protein
LRQTVKVLHDSFMPNDNILVERDLTISHGGLNYDIKARAVSVTQGSQPEEVGNYHLDFTFKGKGFQMWQPDKNLYSRERARKVAETAFTSGQVETYAKREIQSWINIGDVY